MAAAGQVFSFKKLALRRFPKTTEERNNAEEKYWSKYKVGWQLRRIGSCVAVDELKVWRPFLPYALTCRSPLR